MTDTKNALEELAKRLRNGLYINPNDERFDGPVIVRTLDAKDLLAAQRIVAELAKVTLYESVFCKGCFTADVNTVDVIVKCRAIAEEADDVK